jgi:hypothetical protein
MKKQISEEINSMKFLLNYKRGIVISEQSVMGTIPDTLSDKPNTPITPVSPEMEIANKFYKSAEGFGTNPEEMIGAINLISSVNQFSRVNDLVKNKPKKLDIAQTINDEFGNSNGFDAAKIITKLKSLGIVATADIQGDYMRPGTFQIVSMGGNTVVNTTADWSKYPCVPKHPQAKKGKTAKGSEYYQINNYYYYDNGRKYEISTKKVTNYTCNDPEFKVNISTPNNMANNTVNQKTPIPSELKNIEGVKLFQDWLDVNAQGWATGFTKGVLNKGAGYGNFGPRTQKAWNSYGRRFLSRDTEELKPMEIKPITNEPNSKLKPITNVPLQSAQNPAPTVNQGLSQLKPQ